MTQTRVIAVRKKQRTDRSGSRKKQLVRLKTDLLYLCKTAARRSSKNEIYSSAANRNRKFATKIQYSTLNIRRLPKNRLKPPYSRQVFKDALRHLKKRPKKGNKHCVAIYFTAGQLYRVTAEQFYRVTEAVY